MTGTVLGTAVNDRQKLCSHAGNNILMREAGNHEQECTREDSLHSDKS